MSEFFCMRSSGEGDYDRLLISGMTTHLPRRNGLLQLERIGPFIPPLSMPLGGDAIATTAFIEQLRSSPFQDWTSARVTKAHIAASAWNGQQDIEDCWGEPEDAILSAPHDSHTADAIGELVEMILPIGCTVIRSTYNADWTARTMMCSSFVGGDWFHAQLPGGRVPLCSSAFRDWFSTLDNVTRWITFIPTEFHKA